MGLGLTQSIGEFVAGMRGCVIPHAVRKTVLTGFTDCIAVMIAGRDEEPARAVRDIYLPLAAGGRSRVTFGDTLTNAPTAATINGTAAHALDFDDVAMRGHVSAVLVPAILAEAQEVDAPGDAMIAAYVAGYETWGELERRIPEPLHTRGWHPTSVFGTVAAAAACAALRGLKPGPSAHAIALAASHAAGLMANFGSSAKSIHVGRAASAGILCARLAEAGAGGSLDVIENERGFLTTFSPSGKADLSPPCWLPGSPWRITDSRLNVKRYPVCYAAHRAVDAMLDLCAGERVDHRSIDRIRVRLGSIQAAMLRYHRPSSVLEAKFSVEFCLAAAAVEGGLGLAQLSEATLGRAEVAELMDRVEIETTDETDPEMPNYAPCDEIELQLDDGRILVSEPVHRAKGHASRPLSQAELRGKFNDAVSGKLPDAVRDALFNTLRKLHDLPSARALPGGGDSLSATMFGSKPSPHSGGVKEGAR